MNRFFGYVRVSTVKQGEGVSLAEQREAIERFAAKQGLSIVEWYEELETAAKRGRKAFSRMLQALSRGQADGVIIHKIDRSARNLRDWADLGELIDRGIAVHFAAEGLDLGSRGGRLSADIQAVVAADYIRNLREETRKGFYGRLKQGIYPLAAPLGYLDTGAGKPKETDPERGPLVREAFELYASGRYNLRSLSEELHRRGLRNKNGNKVGRSVLSRVLNNPFYTGTIKIMKTGEVFDGAHEPLVSPAILERVQETLRGKTNTKPWKHDYLFRRRVNCAGCGRRLIAELQKGHVYYRCHDRQCPVRCVREEVIGEAIRAALLRLHFTDLERSHLDGHIADLTRHWKRHAEDARAGARLRIGKLAGKLEKLTDAFLDGVIEQELFENRKAAILAKKREAQQAVERTGDDARPVVERLRKLLELADTALRTYETADHEEKRQLLRITTSNLEANRRKGFVELSKPFSLIADRHAVPDSSLK
jgi:DNA invertase Pin-like site-specific DNA recombinase